MRTSLRISIGVALLTLACQPAAMQSDAAISPDGSATDAGADAADGIGGCTTDADGDGHRSIACGGDDCDDADAHRFPGNTEVCDATDHDEDCDAHTFGSRDADGDGYADAACCNVATDGTRTCGVDCNDTQVGVHPDSVEACNLIDDDCDTAVDEGVGITFYEDCDNDGIGTGDPMVLCTPSSCMGHPAVTSNGDCNDTNRLVYPGAPGVCDCMAMPGYDQDGDHHVRPECGGDDCVDTNAMIYPGAAGLCDCTPAHTYDADGDTHLTTACGGDDCDDASAAFHPGAPGTCGLCSTPLMRMSELCDGLDDDCNGTPDDGGASASCSLPNGTPICTAGACAVASCDVGFHACGVACVSDTALATCGSRCVPCAAPPAHASATCDGIACDFACDAGYGRAGATCDIAPPRPIAPLSSSTVTSRRPTFRWLLEPGTDGARVEICRDRACTMILATLDVTASSAAPTSDLPAGVCYWRLASRTGASRSTALGPTWQFTVGVRSAAVDASWGTTLDVNGDGFADVTVGARDGGTGGRAHVFLGSASGLGTAAATTLAGPDAFGGFGGAVASAGDVDGDGFADLVVGGSNAAGGVGAAYVYLGGASGLSSAPVSTLVGPDEVGGSFGLSVASAGDVNRDGYADVVVGAYYVGTGTGRAYVYLGGASGLASTPTATLLAPATDGGFGGSVASAGDVNADGYADVIVSAPTAFNAGSVYLYLGGASGLATTPTLTLAPPDGSLSYFGSSLACAGDVNGDGYADVVIGAFGVSTDTGRAYLYLGSASGLATTPAVTVIGPDGIRGRFGDRVAPAGDVNADGYADVIVGADGVSAFDGRAYVYLGGASGLATAPTSTFIAPDGGAGSGQFGSTLAGAGDVNGDGYAEVIVGAPRVLSNSGRAYLYVGGASGPAPTPTLTLTNPDGADALFGTSVAGAE